MRHVGEGTRAYERILRGRSFFMSLFIGGSIEESKDKLEYDLFYIKHMSVPLDLGIIFETAKVVLLGLGSK